MTNAKDRGFTLWELLISVAVAGVVLGLGVPNLVAWTRNSAMTASANDLVSALMAARTESIRRRVPVTLCMSSDPLAETPACVPDGAGGPFTGYFVWIDENGDLDRNGNPDLNDATDGNATFDAGESVLLRRATGHPVTGPVDLFADRHFVSFDSNGNRRGNVLTPAGIRASATAILLCDSRGNLPTVGSLSAARALRIDPLGRSRLNREVTEIDAAIARAGLSCP